MQDTDIKHFPLCRTVSNRSACQFLDKLVSLLNSLPAGLSDTTVQETLRQEKLAETNMNDQLFASGLTW